MKKTILAALAAVVLLAGCSSPESTAPEEVDHTPSPEPAEITSSPGMETWNEQVIKNNFFNAQDEDCSDLRTYTDSQDYSARIVCESAGTYMWFFDEVDERDAMLPEIVEMGLPMLVSDTWVIASPLDLEAGQKEIGGAINEL